MAKIQLQTIREEIIGLKPLYSDTGNATVIYLRQGEVMDTRGCRSVLKALASCYASDLTAQRRKMEGCLGSKGILPFYLGMERVFIPLKMRKVVSKNDAVYGFLDAQYIGSVVVNGNTRCLLTLIDGRQLEILSSLNTIRQSQQMGQRLLEQLQAERGDDPVIKNVQQLVEQVVSSFREIKTKVNRIEEIVGSDTRKA
ncbi:MAG: hypothetical protein PHF24_07690 [Syntrophomonas sp.]|nr:hypothetical protein [Syntrophomonas sp.]